mmetsp:Transcript_10104/g.14714  ORF Transcript_10104/g.14714 Transcript_10104/m.14714 type:complete len:187 (+) Transcript_10104:324-884(+)
MVMVVVCILVGFFVVVVISCTSLKYQTQDPQRGNYVSTFSVALPDSSRGVLSPVLSFGHGFGISPESYDYVANVLCKTHGYMVFFPHNLGVFPSSVNLAIDQAFILAHAVEQSSSNASSIFFNRVANKTAVMGHSLGGGTAILASDPTILQHHYPAPQVLVALSLSLSVGGAFTVHRTLKQQQQQQ